MLPGVYKTTQKNGNIYYRSSFHFNGKHISLGSYPNEQDAHQAYLDAQQLAGDTSLTLDSYSAVCHTLSYEKAICILNFRDHHIYIKNPIYLETGYFLYYIAPRQILKFDNDDLFYYSSHKIICRKGHMFVNDYGMQYNILSRYGIKNFAVCNKDYTFANGDSNDFRYSNIIVINKYHGVTAITNNGITRYQTKIHLNGDYLIGRYSSEAKAAVAYNKAVDLARDYGYEKNFIENYVLEYTPKEYADVYTSISISHRYMDYIKKGFRSNN